MAAADALWYGTEEERSLLEAVHPVAARRPHAVGTVAIDPPTGARPGGLPARTRPGPLPPLRGASHPAARGWTSSSTVTACCAGGTRTSPWCSSGTPDRLTSPPEGVVSLGWLDDEEHWAALAGAEAVVVPSRLESLSLVALEAWATGRPCLLNGDSPGARGTGGAERRGAPLPRPAGARRPAPSACSPTRRRPPGGRRGAALRRPQLPLERGGAAARGADLAGAESRRRTGTRIGRETDPHRRPPPPG